MAAVSTIIAGAALGVGAVGAYNSYNAQKDQARYARQANEFQQKQANLQNARAKRDAVRAARISYAQAQNASATQGVMDSSSSQGGLSSIASQASDNVSFLDQYGFFSDQASKALGKANAAGASSAMWGSVANLGFSVFSNAEGIAKTFGQK